MYLHALVKHNHIHLFSCFWPCFGPLNLPKQKGQILLTESDERKENIPVRTFYPPTLLHQRNTPSISKGKISWLRGQCCGFHFHFSQSVSVNSQVTYPNFPKFKNHGKTCSNQQNVNLTRSIIPWKKDNLSVYNIRKVYFASLLSFLKKQDRGPTRFEIARHLLV